MFVVIHFLRDCVILLTGTKSVQVLSFVYNYIAVGGSNYQYVRVGIPLTGLIPPHYCACPKPRLIEVKVHVLVITTKSNFLKNTSYFINNLRV
jgi:hypothetical protein